MEHILVVDDERSMLEFLEYMFRKEGYRVTSTQEGRTALQLITDETGFDLVVSDLRIPDLNGLELLRACRETDPELPFIFITAYASSNTAIEAVRLGAYDYVTKPFRVEELKNLVRNALQTRTLKRKVKVLESERVHGNELVGVSPPMLRIYKLIGAIAATDSTVLITGESGTGKELVALAIHQTGGRRDGPFVSVNCGAFAETLLESELFGYMKGAFTGAAKNKKGLFETAEGGTLFLDELAEMSSAMQVKLLRALQEKRVRRVGGTSEICVDVRLIAATNQNLDERIESGYFREDLYYRLAVIPISIPPLRERKADIVPLVRYFIQKYNQRLERSLQGITEEGLACLEEYSWPGNVRELENVIERAVTLETTDFVQKERLPAKVRGRQPRSDVLVPQFTREEGLSLQEHLDQVEGQLIARALELADGNQKQAAGLLKLTYRSFRHRMQRLGLRNKP
ncbi:MAG: sigma-54-dependent transcriptional regulator [Acidobacteriota bacterium]